MLPTFIQSIDVGSIRTYSPHPHTLLCGGVIEDVHTPPGSLRDIFYRQSVGSDRVPGAIVSIEEIYEYYDKEAPYLDYQDFERDLAKLSDLVVLFSESPGSFAELGTFAAYEDIREKSLIVIRSKHDNAPGYIARGPLAKLRREHPNSVFVLSDAEFRIRDQDLSGVDGPSLFNKLLDPIRIRLDESRDRTTLNLNIFGHKARFYVGLLQEFQVLKDSEILQAFELVGARISSKTLDRISFCCQSLRWTRTAKNGFERIHFANASINEAISWPTKSKEDKDRRRAKARAHWQAIDPSRLAARADAGAS